MTRYAASYIGVLADYDHVEGWLVIKWPHESYGYDTLTIDLNGHCARRMPIHSGQGMPEYVELSRDHIRLRFDPQLANKLELAEEIKVSFSLSDDQYADLHRWVQFWESVEE